MKKVISLLLTLSLIIGLFSMIGTVSAADTPNSYDAAYLLSFNDSPENKGLWLGGTEGDAKNKEIIVSFDYYLTDVQSGKIYVANAPGGSFKDDTTGSNTLTEGENSFKSTVADYQYGNMYPAIAAGSGAKTTARLYIWNVKVTIGGVDYTKLNSESWKDDSVVFEPVNYEEVVNAKKVYYINYNETSDYSGCWLSKDYWGTTSEMSVTISFDYYLNGNAKLGVYRAHQSSALKDNNTGSEYLKQGRNTFTYTTDSYSFTGYGAELFYPYIASRGTNTADLYIWNVKVIRNNIDVTAVGYTDAPETVSCETITYGEFIKATTNYYHLDFYGTPNWHGYCLSNDYWYTEGMPVTVSFDYYLNGSSFFAVYSSKECAPLEDDNTGSAILKPGRNTFTYTTNNFSKHDLLYPYITNISSNPAYGDLYIWNVKVIRNSVDVTNVNSGSFCDNIISEILKYDEAANEVSDVYELDYSSNSLYAFSDTESKEWYDTNTAVTVTFDYYLANADDGELIVQDNASAKAYNDTATGDNKLYAGRHSFCFTTDNFNHNKRGCIAVGIKLSDEGAESKSKLYIINPRIIIKSSGGHEQNKFGIGVDLSSIVSEYSLIPNKGDSNNDGIVNILDLIRSKKYFVNSNIMIDRENLNVNDDAAIDSIDLNATRKLLLGIKAR